MNRDAGNAMDDGFGSDQIAGAAGVNALSALLGTTSSTAGTTRTGLTAARVCTASLVVPATHFHSTSTRGPRRELRRRVQARDKRPDCPRERRLQRRPLYDVAPIRE